jgi:hypothetical protein
MPDANPQCGSRFAYLVQVDGYGPDNPTGWKPWASEEDVGLWIGTAKYIFGLVRKRWNVLMDSDNRRQDWTRTRAIREYIAGYEQDFAKLPEPKWWQAIGASEAVSAVVKNCQSGACALDLLEDQLATVPGRMPVPYQPRPAPSLLPKLRTGVSAGVTGALLFAGVAGVAYLVTKE